MKWAGGTSWRQGVMVTVFSFSSLIVIDEVYVFYNPLKAPQPCPKPPQAECPHSAMPGAVLWGPAQPRGCRRGVWGLTLKASHIGCILVSCVPAAAPNDKD